MADLTAEFYGHLARDGLHLQRCGACGTFRHLPRHLCPDCHSEDWAWVRASDRGEVLSWTITLRPLHPAFADTPLTLVTVALAEGPRLLGPLEGVAPEAVRAGLPVRVEPRALATGVALPAFRPVDA